MTDVLGSTEISATSICHNCRIRELDFRMALVNKLRIKCLPPANNVFYYHTWVEA